MSGTGKVRLNPCFNGRYSLRNEYEKVRKVFRRLNPCFNGRYSLSGEKSLLALFFSCLNPCFNGRYSLSCLQVLRE